VIALFVLVTCASLASVAESKVSWQRDWEKILDVSWITAASSIDFTM
jgi:hypothetical protein